MRRMLLRAAAVLGVGLALVAGPGKRSHGADLKKADAAKVEGTCSTHNTTVDFFDSPQAAAQKAKKEQKLVLVLHVSGNFETPDFT